MKKIYVGTIAANGAWQDCLGYWGLPAFPVPRTVIVMCGYPGLTDDLFLLMRKPA